MLTAHTATFVARPREDAQPVAVAASSRSAESAEAAVTMRVKPAPQAAVASRSLLTTVVAAHSRVHAEIGRASCRERVGQDGSITGVAVSSKKKHIKRVEQQKIL